MVSGHQRINRQQELTVGGAAGLTALLASSSASTSAATSREIPPRSAAVKAVAVASSGVAVELEELLPEHHQTAENGTYSRLTVLVGETVLLPCKAYSLGQRTVSPALSLLIIYLLFIFPLYIFQLDLFLLLLFYIFVRAYIYGQCGVKSN